MYRISNKSYYHFALTNSLFPWHLEVIIQTETTNVQTVEYYDLTISNNSVFFHKYQIYIKQKKQ